MSELPYGALVWVAGITPRDITKRLMAKIGPSVQNDRRGLVVDGNLKVCDIISIELYFT